MQHAHFTVTSTTATTTVGKVTSGGVKFPPRPEASIERVQKPASTQRKSSGPPPFVPKIKSFAERRVPEF